MADYIELIKQRLVEQKYSIADWSFDDKSTASFFARHDSFSIKTCFIVAEHENLDMQTFMIFAEDCRKYLLSIFKFKIYNPFTVFSYSVAVTEKIDPEFQQSIENSNYSRYFAMPASNTINHVPIAVDFDRKVWFHTSIWKAKYYGSCHTLDGTVYYDHPNGRFRHTMDKLLLPMDCNDT